jgi:DNA-binding CsgD family transcriptional regulator
MLSEVGKGSSIAAIAEALFMSVGTVNYRLKKIYSYFGVESKAQLEELVNSYIPQVGKLVEG